VSGEWCVGVSGVVCVLFVDCKISDFKMNVVLWQSSFTMEIFGAMYGLISIPIAGVRVLP
jgi:hypothetical protein